MCSGGSPQRPMIAAGMTSDEPCEAVLTLQTLWVPVQGQSQCQGVCRCLGQADAELLMFFSGNTAPCWGKIHPQRLVGRSGAEQSGQDSGGAPGCSR